MKNIMVVAAITLSLGALPALADGPLPTNTESGHVAGTERKPVLCALWMLQNMAARTGLQGQASASVDQTSYPVPAPIWIMNTLFGAS
jgi:hypothetical protein